MTRRKKKDENEMAFGVRAFTEQMAEGKPTEKPQIDRAALSAAAKALSMLGASKGGKARAEKLSARRRKEIAKKAAETRWKGNENG